MFKKKKLNLFRYLMEFGEFPAESLGSTSKLELIGDCEVFVSACESILEFERDRIVIKGVDMKFEIIGQELELSEFLPSGVFARGKVSEVRLLRGNE